jgi:hypothetical protein
VVLSKPTGFHVNGGQTKRRPTHLVGFDPTSAVSI